jgi:tetratricopeptide (TPR) repeat protein
MPASEYFSGNPEGLSMKPMFVVVIACLVIFSASTRNALGQGEIVFQIASKAGPPVCIFLANHLGGKLLDGAFDGVTGKPNIRVLHQRLIEIETNFAIKKELQDAIRLFRLELDDRVTRDELENRLASLRDKLVGLYLRLEDLEIDRELHQVRLDDIQNKTKNAVSAKYFVDRGKHFQGNGDFVRANANFSAALRVDEKYADAYVARAIAHLDMNAIEIADIDFASAIQKVQTSTEARIGKAATCLELGRFAEGVEHASLALRLESNGFDAHFIRGWCHIGTSDTKSALTDFKQCVELKPNSGIAHNALAKALQMEKNYAASENAYKKAIDLLPRPRYFLNRGLMRNEQGNYSGAVEDINASLRHVSLKPSSDHEDYERQAIKKDIGLGRVASFIVNPKPIDGTALPFEQRGFAFHNLNQDDRAIEDLTRAIEFGTENGWTYVVRGLSFSRQGKHASAIDDLKRGVGIGVGDSDHVAFEALLRSYTEVGDPVAASFYSDKYFSSKNGDKNNAAALFNSFIAQEGCGKGSSAYSLLEDAIAINPTLESLLKCGYLKVVNKTNRAIDLCPDYWINFDNTKTDVNNNWAIKGSEVKWRFPPGEEALIRYKGELFRSKKFSAWVENANNSKYGKTWTWTIPEGAAVTVIEIEEKMLPK